MKVFGYTENFALMPVNLPVEVVAANMIDPWRVDLVDPQPVSLQFGTKRSDGTSWCLPPFRFRRQQDLCFAYRDSHSMIYVGICRGDETICVTGVEKENSGDIELSNIEPSKRPFSEHFAEYLRQSLVARHDTRTPHYNLFKPWCNQPTIPRQAAAAQLFGNKLTVLRESPSLSRNAFEFTGEMFSERSFSMPLQDDVNWLLEVLKPWEPAVFGAAIRACMGKERSKQIDVCVAPGSLGAGREFLRSTLRARYYPGVLTSDAERWSFSRPYDELFEVRGRLVQVAERSVSSVTDWMRSGIQFYSVDLLYSRQPNQCSAARIAMADLFHRQARALSRFSVHAPGGHDFFFHEMRLHREKLKVLRTYD